MQFQKKALGMENLNFSEEEIEQQLAALGYENISKQRLHEFKRDLDILICYEKSNSRATSTNSPETQTSSGKTSPAITKEKVRIHSASQNSYLCLHIDAAEQQRQVLTSTFNENSDDNFVAQEVCDYYIKHSVAPGYIRSNTASNKVELEEALSTVYDSVIETSQTVIPDRDLRTTGKATITRKVHRKLSGQSQVCDESTGNNTSEAVDELEEHLDQLQVSAHGCCKLDLEYEETRPHRKSDIQHHPKSFIRPVMGHPHTRNWKKTDPVSKYFQYKQNWEMFKTSEEKRRKDLHWAIKELMFHSPQQKPQKTYAPNSYVVPTEKKRSALRWKIRYDMANGIIPTKKLPWT